MVAKVLVAAGSEVNVGDPIMVVVEDEDDVSAFKDFKADSAKTATTQAPAPSPDPAPAPPAAVNRSLPAAEQPASPANSGRVVASPRARMLARERGYDLSVIAGSVPGGRVVAAHVISHSPSPPPPSGDQGVGKEDAIRVPPSEVGTLDIRVKPESASIAARLTYSVQTAPVSRRTSYALRSVCACAAALLLDHGICSRRRSSRPPTAEFSARRGRTNIANRSLHQGLSVSDQGGPGRQCRVA